MNKFSYLKMQHCITTVNTSNIEDYFMIVYEQTQYALCLINKIINGAFSPFFWLILVPIKFSSSMDGIRN